MTEPGTTARRVIPVPLLVLAAVVGALAVGAAVAFQPIAAVALVVGMVYALLVLERPVVGIYTCFALVPVTAGLRRGLPIPGLKLTEALLLGTFVLVAGFAGRTRPWAVIDRVLALYAAGALLLPLSNVILFDSPMTTDGLRKMSAAVMFVVLFRLARIGNLNDRERWFALRLLFAGTVPVVLVALGQRFDVPGVRDAVANLTEGAVFEVWSYTQGGAGTRATGLFENWHSLAGYLFPLLLVGVAILGQRGMPRDRVRAGGVVIAVALVGMVAAQTITTLAVAVAAALLVGGIQGRFARTFTLILALAMFAIVVSGGALTDRVATQFEGSGVGQNVEARLEIWTVDYADPLQRYWATGYGPEVPPEVIWEHTESLYVTLILRGGIALLALYFMLTLVVARVAWDGRHSANPLDRVLSTAIFAAALGSMAMHLVFPYLNASGFPQVFWLLVGLLPAAATSPTNPASDMPADGQQLVRG